MNGLTGKKFSRAFGGLGVDFSVKTEFEFGVRHHFSQVLHQFDEGGGLARAEPVGAEIPHQADADRNLVE